jgi:hypothetical protein
MPEITNSIFSGSYKSYKRKYVKNIGTKKGRVKTKLPYISKCRTEGLNFARFLMAAIANE